MYRVLLAFILFVIQVEISEGVSSIPISNVHDQGLQSQNVKLVMVDSVSYSATITFLKQKKSIINQLTNIIMGISQMDYDANHRIGNYYFVNFQLTVPSVTLTGMQIALTNNINDMKSISLTILIISNEYRYQPYMQGYKVTYSSLNSYYYDFQTWYSSNYSVSVYGFVNAMHIKTYYLDKILSFSFSYTLPIVGNYCYVSSSIYYGFVGSLIANVTMKLFVINRLYLSSTDIKVSQYYVYEWTSPFTLPFYNPNASQLLKGLISFYFQPNTFNLLNGVSWKETFTSNTSLTFTLDDQFSSFRYIILVFNSYGCPNYLFPIQGWNSTASPAGYECYDQCYYNQYEYYNTNYMDYMCSSCHLLCVGCYSYAKCKQCIAGYTLQSNNSCILNDSYFINSSVYTPLPCSNNFTGCDQCTKYGNYCLTCQKHYYVSSNTIESYSITIGNVTTSYTVPAVTCSLCSSRIPDCLTCNATVCFTCQSPTELITPTLCSIPTNEIFSVLQPCSDVVRCKKCLQSALDNCLECFDAELTLVNGQCVSPCGDGILLDQQVCDDSNTLSYDGCSSDCMTVQRGWQCQTLPGTRKSYCEFIADIPLSLQSITKLPIQNKVIVIMQNLMPQIRLWTMFGEKELKQILNFQVDEFSNNSLIHKGYEFQYSVKFAQKSHSTNRILQQQLTDSFDLGHYKFIQLTIEYNAPYTNLESLNHQSTSLKLSPRLSQWAVFANTQEFSISFPLYTDQNHMIQFYTTEYYSLYSTVKITSMIVGVLMLVILMISVFSCLLEGNNSRQILLSVETASVVQFTYFSLLGIKELNPLFIALAEGLKFSCGFDINLNIREQENRILLGVGIQSTNILNNVNTSLILPVVFILVGAILLIIKKVKAKRKNSQNDKLVEGEQKQPSNILHSIQQGCKFYEISKILVINLGFGLFLFFLYKYLISILVQIIFGQPQGVSFVVISFIIVLLLLFLLLMFLKFELFSKLTEKLSTYLSAKDKLLMEDIEYAEQLVTQRTKKRKVYLITIILERVINSATLILFLQSAFELHGLIPIVISLLQTAYVYFYNCEIYNPPHKYRLYLNYTATFMIQVLLLIRKLLLLDNEEVIGAEESNYGLYLPFSILLLLLIVELNALAFLIYSIKRIRCCQLEIEWERLDQSLEEQLKEKNTLKEKFSKNIQTANKISNPLTLKATHQSVIGSSNPHYSNQSLSSAFNENDNFIPQHRFQNESDKSDRDKKNEKQLSQGIELQECCSQIKENSENQSYNSYKSNRTKRNLSQKTLEREFSQLKVGEQDKKITNDEIKKQLKYLLKKMKIPQTNNQNKNRDLFKNRKKNKKTIYHYVNQGIYNVYQEYDKI